MNREDSVYRIVFVLASALVFIIWLIHSCVYIQPQSVFFDAKGDYYGLITEAYECEAWAHEPLARCTNKITGEVRYIEMSEARRAWVKARLDDAKK
jgi:hypothetical protein